uniref:SFRICE_033313 n=1 Tax=Spodoptera frugiperda TaxID=7108 RepID=A0A2H1WMQ6_SPOFR
MVGRPQLCASRATFCLAQQNCGMSCRRRYFRTDTTFKPSRKEHTPFKKKKAGNAPVTPLVLRVSMGGADRLPSVVATSLECPVYGNKLTPLLHGTYNTNGEKWVYIRSAPPMAPATPEESQMQKLLQLLCTSCGAKHKL